jgi:hypothetical protein
LNSLALGVALQLQKHGKQGKVSVGSIWIDGTPQAKAQTQSGATVKCELADLLFLLEERDPSGKIKKETALLIQGKATPTFNKLPSGKSTQKERQLLEWMNRSKPLELYKDTKASKNSKIGTYLLSSNICGLSDCSRYLLMPNSLISPAIRTIAPFQIGWPNPNNSHFLKSPRGIVEAIQRMALFSDIGKEVIDPTKCEWSRLVNDLCGTYKKIVMKGYGGQLRIISSSWIAHFNEITYSMNDFCVTETNEPPRILFIKNVDTDEFIPPKIPIIKICIEYSDRSGSQ